MNHQTSELDQGLGNWLLKATAQRILPPLPRTREACTWHWTVLPVPSVTLTPTDPPPQPGLLLEKRPSPSRGGEGWLQGPFSSLPSVPPLLFCLWIVPPSGLKAIASKTCNKVRSLDWMGWLDGYFDESAILLMHRAAESTGRHRMTFHPAPRTAM